MAVAITPCLDAVAHGGNPQDRAASLNFWGGFPPEPWLRSGPVGWPKDQGQ
ncbi:hypothetical protein [Moorena sp. SIO4G3]|uniref:hypothetical protein n=1 Tax=Moorena sp. SIO4G3 TaxID=2607821 RepID=UPI001429E62F|nr:hypothetical protein [Moorena sp. SIO4G3]NEO82438.1 hypothetical protein [Moorena sp. SIO4G3]